MNLSNLQVSSSDLNSSTDSESICPAATDVAFNVKLSRRGDARRRRMIQAVLGCLERFNDSEKKTNLGKEKSNLTGSQRFILRCRMLFVATF